MTITKPSHSKPKAYWEERAKKFGGQGMGHKAICSYGMPWFYNAYIDRVQKKALYSVLRVKKQENILDLGCGVGRWSLELARRGALVTGADLSEEMISIAKENADKEGLSITFIVAAVADLKIIDEGSFDKALAVTVLQHIMSKEELMESVKVVGRVLKKGGTFFLLEAAPGKEIKRLDTDIFTARTFEFYKELFEANGLILEDVRAVDPSPFKRWLLPHYKNMPRVLKGILITFTTLLSFLMDSVFSGTRGLVSSSWHKVMVFRKI